MADDNFLTVTREELYEEVWQTPMVHLARKYRLSDVGFAKMLKELNVPHPGPGHWRKVESGKRVRRKPLPKARDGDVTAMRFNLNWSPPERQQLPVEVEGWLARAKQDLVAPVPDELTNPHPLTKKTRAVLRGARSSNGHLEHGYKDRPLDLRVSANGVDRALRVMDALIRACGTLDVEIQLRNGRGAGMFAVRDDVAVRFWLHERVERHEIPAKRDRLCGSHEYVPTGIMCFRIPPEFGKDIRRVWSDGTKQKLEDCVAAVAVGLARAIESHRVRLHEYAEASRRREAEEAERRRVQEAERRKRQEEEERRRALLDDCERWHQAGRIRAYVDAVLSKGTAPGTSDRDADGLRAWASWAIAFADELDPLDGRVLDGDGTTRSGAPCETPGLSRE